MTNAYDTWTSGQKLSTTIMQEIVDAQGAINNDAFHSEQLSSYVVFPSGSNYYVRNGSDGTIESSGTSTSSSTSINWAIDQLADRGGVVTLKGLFSLDGTINMDQYGVILQGDSLWYGDSSGESGTRYCGLDLEDSVDADMISVTAKACAVRNLFLDGNKANQTSGNGIKINYTGGNSDCHLSHIYMFYAKDYGVSAGGSTYANFVFSEFCGDSNWYINGDYSRFVGCTGTSGDTNGYQIPDSCEQNRFIGCTASTNTQRGFLIEGDYNVLNGCQIYNNGYHGIVLDGADLCVIDGCQLTQNSQDTHNTYSHIYLDTASSDHANYNVITNNIFANPTGTKVKYDIEESSANQDFNVIHDNRYGSAGTNYVSLSGLNDELATISVPFSNGTAYHDMGWDVDASSEYATAWFTLPSDVTQLVRMYIYAVSVVAEADAMELDISVDGGAGNEAYVTHTYSGSGVNSTETNFAGSDIIYWLVTDSNVLALKRFDSVQVKVEYAAAAGANCATDARFRNVFVEYV